MTVLETPRLKLRWLNLTDADFILRLVNDPSWLRYIGDKGIETVRDAENYIRNGPIAMYGALGFGLYLIECRENAQPMGLCGLIRREPLDDIDLGFALLPEYRGNGYAFEAASATMAYGRETFRLSRIVAVTSRDNHLSGRMLGKLGFCFERMVRLAPDADELKLYAVAV